MSDVVPSNLRCKHTLLGCADISKTAVYIELVTDVDSHSLEIPIEYVPALSIIGHFRSLYGSSTFDGKSFGTVEYPIRFYNIDVTAFTTILELLKLKCEHNISFHPIGLTFSSLLKYGWDSILLPPIYLKTIEELPTELLILCMYTCMKLSLYNLCKLIVCRVIYVLNTDKSGDEIVEITECFARIKSPAELALYHDMCRAFIMSELDQKRREKRSASF